ncbi:unnamed protein product [Paramecium primaurelia]|uniref:RING-type domain-containing protein n=1 Tax=Paramecium primaurelia TaxID=5886 RepID=A0A8S1PWH9_PARPR|nr:unnamed protein product [Paramecium primaurelia]
MSLPITIVDKNNIAHSSNANKNDLVYQKIKEFHGGDNDILVFSEDVICYFDESFSQFKKRISKNQDLIIYVKSLSQIQNQLIEIQHQLIDIQKENDEYKKAYKLLQDDIRYQSIKDSQIQQKKLEFQIISTDGNSTTFNSTIFEQRFNNQTIEKLLGEVTKIKRITSISSSKLCQSEIYIDNEITSQVISQIDICYFCNMSIDKNRIQLPCYHNFHEECLVSIFFGQLENQCNSSLSCLCNQTQSAQIILLIQEKNSQILLRHKLLQNQLNKLVKDYKLEKCQTLYCYYYFKRNNQLKIQNNFCPLCLC